MPSSLRFFAPLFVLLTGLSGLEAQTRAAQPRIDKSKIEGYVRHLFVWPEAIHMEIADPQPTSIAGMYSIKVKGSQGEASQEETFYVSADGQNIMRGDLYQLSTNPFKAQLDLLKTESQPAFGTSGAPVVVAEFSDFECPFCRQEATVLRENLQKTYPTEVRFYFMDFPLESLHPWAKDAAIAGRCVYHQNPEAFWDYHDWIFSSQQDITPENLKDKVLAFAAGKSSGAKSLDGAALSSCIESKATAAEVQRTRDMGHALDVDQTPTVFVNGRRLTGAVRWEDLQRVIDFEIGYQKVAKDAGDDCGCTVKLPTPGMPEPAAPGSLAKGSPAKDKAKK